MTFKVDWSSSDLFDFNTFKKGIRSVLCLGRCFILGFHCRQHSCRWRWGFISAYFSFLPSTVSSPQCESSSIYHHPRQLPSHPTTHTTQSSTHPPVNSLSSLLLLHILFNLNVDGFVWVGWLAEAFSFAKLLQFSIKAIHMHTWVVKAVDGNGNGDEDGGAGDGAVCVCICFSYKMGKFSLCVGAWLLLVFGPLR